MGNLSRRGVLARGACALILGVAGFARVTRAASTTIEVYRSPSCGCCGAWISHMRANGFEARVIETDDLAPIKSRLGVAEDLQSCHTALVEGYVIEGHVPAADVKRLLTERPAALGLAVPGMPLGSPGMEQGDRRERYKVILFAKTGRSVFVQH